jgi:hypothetical protein
MGAMFSLSFPLPLSAIDLLNLLFSVLLLVSAVVVFVRDIRSPLHQRYALTALSLLGWVATLPLYYRATDSTTVLWLGRFNFAAAALAVTFGYLLVCSLAKGKDRRTARFEQRSKRFSLPIYLFVAEGAALALVSTFTPLIARDELLSIDASSRHVTVYGTLFPLYVVHIVGYLIASALVAFRARRHASGPVRDRLTLVGAGVLATGVVGVIADIVLPYGMGDFRFTDAGPLSTALFLLAVGYAVLRHHLFDLRLFVRRTLVQGLLLLFVAAAYSAIIALVTEHLTSGSAGLLTRFGVFLIAATVEPLKRYLDKRIDRFLFKEVEQ